MSVTVRPGYWPATSAATPRHERGRERCARERCRRVATARRSGCEISFTPGADMKTSGKPKFEKIGDPSLLSVAATPTAPGQAAG